MDLNDIENSDLPFVDLLGLEPSHLFTSNNGLEASTQKLVSGLKEASNSKIKHLIASSSKNLSQGDMEATINSSRQALELDRANIDARMYLAFVYAINGDYSAAESVLDTSSLIEAGISMSSQTINRIRSTLLGIRKRIFRFAWGVSAAEAARLAQLVPMTVVENSRSRMNRIAELENKIKKLEHENKLLRLQTKLARTLECSGGCGSMLSITLPPSHSMKQHIEKHRSDCPAHVNWKLMTRK